MRNLKNNMYETNRETTNALKKYIAADISSGTDLSEINRYNNWDRVRISQQNVHPIWEMYKKNYPDVRQIDVKSFLDKYKFAFVCHRNVDGLFLGYICFEITKFGFKLNLSGTITEGQDKDLSAISAQLVQNKKARLLVTPGYYQEASGAVSWILRSKFRLKPILDKPLIEKIFNEHHIDWNSDYADKPRSEVYTRRKGDSVRTETLFGIPCTNFYKLNYVMLQTDECEVECVSKDMYAKFEV